MYSEERYIRNIIREAIAPKNKGIICYHRSDDYEHMVKGEFSLEYSNDVALFGHAIYFAESPNISQQLGKYICKFSIKTQSPVLNMNDEMSAESANLLLKKFNKISNAKIGYDFDDEFGKIQYGEFFNEISGYMWNYNSFYKQFIKSLGYNSFKYFGNYHTDFLYNKGDYGLCYGIYNEKDIEFVDGPF